MSEISEAIRTIVGDMRTFGIPCKVTAVNGMTCDVEPVNGDAPINRVRLVADEKNDRFVMIPKVGSVVMVHQVADAAGYVSMVSEVDKVTYKRGDTVFEVDERFALEKGADSLKDILKKIIEAMQVIVVIQGKGPDLAKLLQAMNSTNNLFK